MGKVHNIDVCHTEEECEQLYAAISGEKKAPALEFLRKGIKHDRAAIKREFDADPKNWIAPYHMWWGMGIRNQLRTAGFGEEYFLMHNLDCIYRLLIEEALDLKNP